MKNITIFIFNNASASTIVGPMDIFSSTGIFWNYFKKKDMKSYFKVELASLDGESVTCFNGLSISPHTSIDHVDDTDLILLPAIVDDVFNALKANAELLPWLIDQNKKGTPIASVCTGAFFLAEAGLLNHRKATTHWGFADVLKQHYPKVKLDTRPLITKDRNILCSAGTSSWSELCMYIIKAFYGIQLAMECSKSLGLDMSRTTQEPYNVLTIPDNHKDSLIHDIQEWLQSHYPEKISISSLADQFMVSERTLTRRFKKATGSSPIVSLQFIRIEAAKGFLEQNNLTIDEIAFKTGYEDISFFRTLFKRHTGLSPNEYRKKFLGLYL